MKKLLILTLFIFNTLASDLNVGLFNVPPFAYLDEKENIQGVIYKLVKRIEKESGLKFNIKLFPYSRLQSNIKTGSTDLGIFYPNINSKTYDLRFVPTLGNINFIVGHSKKISNISELEGKKVALIRNASYGKEFDSNTKIEKVNIKTYDQALNLLKIKRVDFIIITSAAFYDLCNKGMCNTVHKKNIYHYNEKKNWIHLSKSVSKEKREKIKKANEKIMKDNFQYLHDLL